MNAGRLFRIGRRFVAGLGIALPLALLSITAAGAHVGLVSSQPADGGVSAEPPASATLDFSKEVSPVLLSVTLTDSAGHQVPLPASAIGFDPAHPGRATVTLPRLEKDSYRLTYDIRDSVDLHQTRGSIVFGVGVTPTTTGSSETTPTRPAEVAFRALATAGVSLLAGGLLWAFWLLPARISGAPLAGAQRLSLAAAGAGAILKLLADGAGFLDGVLVEKAGSDPVSLLTGSAFGYRFLASVSVSTGIGLLVLFALPRGRARQPRAGLLTELRGGYAGWLSTPVRLVVLLILEAAVMGFSAHSGADTRPDALSVSLRAVHLLATTMWAGGVIVMGLLALGRRLNRIQPPELPVLFRSLSPVAAASFLVAVVTGLLIAGTDVATVTALLATSYGAVLMVKAAVVLVAGAIAGVQLLRLRATARGGVRLGPGLAVEAGLASVALIAAGGLAATVPALGPQFDPAPARLPTLRSEQVDDLQIGLSVKPNRPGTNLIEVKTVSTRRPAPAPITAVTVTYGHSASTPPVRQLQAVTSPAQPLGTYDVGSVELTPGDAFFRVAVERRGLPTEFLDLNWQVGGPVVARHPTVISNQPLAPLVDLAAVMLALAAAGFVYLRMRGRGRIDRTGAASERQTQLTSPGG